MERVSRDMPESPARRVGRIARVGARYGFGFVFRSRLLPGRRREEPGRVGMRLRLSLQELGPTFAELGRFLSFRRDLIPPDVAAELGGARVLAKQIGFAEARAYIERELGNTLERLFTEFEERPVRARGSHPHGGAQGPPGDAARCRPDAPEARRPVAPGSL